MKKIITEFMSPRLLRTWRENNSIVIQFHLVNAEDLRRERLALTVIFIIVIAMAAAMIFDIIQILTASHGRSIDLFELGYSILILMFPLWCLHKLKAVFLVRRIRLTPDALILQERFLENEWQEKMVIPHKEIELSDRHLLLQFFHLFRNPPDKIYLKYGILPKELIGDRSKREMDHVRKITRQYAEGKDPRRIELDETSEISPPSKPEYEAFKKFKVTIGNSNLSRVDLAAIMLCAWGIIETVLLVVAIMMKTGFSGGCVFYVWLAYKLYKRNRGAYSSILNGLNIFLALAFGGLIFLLYLLLCYALSSGPIPLILEWGFEWWIMILTLLYLMGCPTMMILLSHPDARGEVGLPPTGSGPLTLYLKRWHFALICTGGILLICIMIGPHFSYNRFTLIREGLAADAVVHSSVGTPKIVTCKYQGDHNWTIAALCEVKGDRGVEVFDVRISPHQELTVKIHQKKSGSSDTPARMRNWCHMLHAELISF